MEEPSREPNATGSNDPVERGDDPNARVGATDDRDWSAGRLSVVEADTAAAAFRPSWETEWAAPSSEPTTQPAQDASTSPTSTKSFGEAPAALPVDAKGAKPAGAGKKGSKKKQNGKASEAKGAPSETKPASEAKGAPSETKPANEAKAAPSETKPASEAKGAPSETKPASESQTAPSTKPSVSTKPAAPPTTVRASERPLSPAEVRAISAETTDGFPALVPSTRPTKAIVAGVAVVLVLLVGTVWSMTSSSEETVRSADVPSTAFAAPEPREPSATHPPEPRVDPAVAPAEVAAQPEESAPPDVAEVEAPEVAPAPAEAPVEVRVTVRTVPSNATLTLDGAPVTSPITRPQDLLARTHTLEARAEGYEPRSEAVRFDRDGTVRIELRRVPPPPPVRPPTTATAPTRTTSTMSTRISTMSSAMAPVRITTMSTSPTPMRATMSTGAGFTTDNPY